MLKNKTRLLLILVDGCRYDYLSASIYMQELSARGLSKKLKTLWGYSAGIHASIWTGTRQATHGMWMKYKRKQNSTSIQGIRDLSNRLYYGIPSGFMRTALNKLEESNLKRESSRPPGMPWQVCNLFEVEPWLNDSMNNYPIHFRNLRVPSLFDTLDMLNLPYTFINVDPSSEISREKLAPTGRKNEVQIVLINNLDGAGHHLGPELDKMGPEISKTDNILKVLIENTEYEHLIIFSDHGMTRVNSLANIQDAIKPLNLVLGKDYEAFCDASFCRFWFDNDRAEDKIISVLNHLQYGKVLSPTDLSTHGIDFDSEGKFKFGNLIFAANPGVYFFPNYLHCILGNKIKGIHGYNPEHPSSAGIFIYAGKRVGDFNSEKWISALDVFPTALNLLGLKTIPSIEGKSAVR